MTLDIAALEAAAGKATEGPWFLTGGGSIVKAPVAPSQYVGESRPTLRADVGGPNWEADAEFIAAANPSVVLELIRRLKAAEEEVKFQTQAKELTALMVLQERARAERAEEISERWKESWKAAVEDADAQRRTAAYAEQARDRLSCAHSDTPGAANVDRKETEHERELPHRTARH